MIEIIVISIVALVLGGGGSWYLIQKQTKTKFAAIIREAEAEAEVIKKNKLLEIKEKFINMKAELEKQINARNAKIQQIENKLKQREIQLNQKQEEIEIGRAHV